MADVNEREFALGASVVRGGVRPAPQLVVALGAGWLLAGVEGAGFACVS
ncbi:MAG: hypothetical protein KC766_24345 [Myxococcales bacterium]|nr:hypothetical protein [Myxococcales bacterium]